MAYRQERNGAGVASEFYQVSPEVPMAWCRSVLPSSDVLEDPVLKYASFVSEPAPWNVLSMVFLDRVPHIAGYDYRYQFVYFDGRGEISGYRTSNWITAVEP